MKTIILDRDGVINQDSDAYIKSPEEFIPIDGSLEAIARLNQAGYQVLVATNQSGIARGYFTEQILHQMHQKLAHALALVGGKVECIVFCPHGPEDDCQCRKPKPGLIQELIKRYNIDVDNLVVVGDSLRDLQAAVAVGAKPVLVKTGKGEKTLKSISGTDADDNTKALWRNLPVYENLSAFVNDYIK